MDPKIAECYEKAKEAWLADHPGSTDLGWELTSDNERDQYFYEEMQRAGFTMSTMNNGYIRFD